jgi:predicted exporter
MTASKGEGLTAGEFIVGVLIAAVLTGLAFGGLGFASSYVLSHFGMDITWYVLSLGLFVVSVVGGLIFGRGK